jgi:hypothetical protein
MGTAVDEFSKQLLPNTLDGLFIALVVWLI